MDVATMRQLRGLVLAWREAPARYKSPKVGRLRLPSLRPLNGKGSRSSKVCRWCRRLVEEKGRRQWHERCVVAYYAATGKQSGLAEEMRRSYRRANDWADPGCLECGQTAEGARILADGYRQQANALREQYHGGALGYQQMHEQYADLMGKAHHAEQFELDHKDALSVAAAAGDERRAIRALTLGNLRWLCHLCHATKTGIDRRKWNNLMNGLPEDAEKPARLQASAMARLL